jgi:bacterioferritin-associated ferredoxin
MSALTHGSSRFLWNGCAVSFWPGDSIAAALYRNGIRTLASTRKRHLPLGFSGAYLQGVLGRVDGRPNVRLDLEPAADGLKVSAQNTWPCARFDLLRLARWLPSRWLRGGFEHPRLFPGGTRRFQAWERILWHLAGVARPAARSSAPSCPVGRRVDVDVLVVGGGPQGRRFANEAAAAGHRVALACRSAVPGAFARAMGVPLPEIDSRVEVVSGTEVFGVYREGTLAAGAPHDHRSGATVFSMRQLMLAVGKRSMPPLVPGAHLPGVMDAHSALRLAHDHGVRLGGAVAVLGTGGETEIAQRIESLGTPVVHCGSIRELRRVEGYGSVRGILVNARIACDAVVHCGPWAADPSLDFQAACEGLIRLTPGASAERVVVAKSAEQGDQSFMIGTEGLKEALVCPCMDVTAGEVLERIAGGETDPEELKRATSCGMGPCQGMPCWLAMAALIDSRTIPGDSPGAQDLRPSFRPPRRAITVAQAAALHGLVDPDR